MNRHEEKKVVDGIELYARYQVVYRDADMKKRKTAFGY